MTPQEFRDTIRELGLSQTSFAEQLGLARSTVARWALGKSPVPRYAMVYLEERLERVRLKGNVMRALNL
jgi:transcriptional regulator with XRE-family HTH domain